MILTTEIPTAMTRKTAASATERADVNLNESATKEHTSVYYQDQNQRVISTSIECNHVRHYRVCGGYQKIVGPIRAFNLKCRCFIDNKHHTLTDSLKACKGSKYSDRRKKDNKCPSRPPMHTKPSFKDTVVMFYIRRCSREHITCKVNNKNLNSTTIKPCLQRSKGKKVKRSVWIDLFEIIYLHKHV